MAKKKGKGKGSPSKWDFETKQHLEKELHESLFKSGGKRNLESDPKGVDSDPGGASSSSGGSGSTQAEEGEGSGRQISGGGAAGGSSPGLNLGTAGSGGAPLTSRGPPPLHPVVLGKFAPPKPRSGGFWRPGAAGSSARGSLSAWSGRSRSFAQVLRGNRRAAIAERLHHIPDVDGDCINYTCEEVAEAGAEWAATLVGAVMGPPISSGAIVTYIKTQGKIDAPKLFVKQSGILIFKFQCEEDMSWVIEHGPWSIGSSPLLLKQWVVGEAMDWCSFKSVPIWVRILDIPPLFCSTAMLSMIGSGIGRPLCIDEFTSSQEMLNFARLLVDVDVEQSKRRYVMLRNEKGVECKLKVIFEWSPWCCDRCRCFGHTNASCLSVSKGNAPDAVGANPGSLGIAKGYPSNHGVSDGVDGATASCVDPPSGGINRPMDKAAPNAKETDATTPRQCQEHGTAAAATSGGSQAVQEAPLVDATQGECNVDAVKNLNGVHTEGDAEALAETKAPSHEKSIACARIVASSWAAESGIYSNCDGELEINEIKTPDGLVKWKTRDGIRKGSYWLRGTRAGLRGDSKLSLTMDELYSVMSEIKNPRSGVEDAALFREESDVEGFDSSSDEDYQPG